jgi:hypothetical protein
LPPCASAWCCVVLLCNSRPKTAPNEGIGIKDRGLVCTMLGLCGRGSGAARGLRALGLLLQRGDGGGRRCRSAPCGNVCSSFLEGKYGLGGIKALLSVGLSASCIVYGGVEGAMGACLELCNGEVPARLLAVCIEGEGMHMVVYRSRCPRTAVIRSPTRPHSRPRARDGEQHRGKAHTGAWNVPKRCQQRRRRAAGGGWLWRIPDPRLSA